MSFIVSLDDIDVITAWNWKIVWYVMLVSKYPLCFSALYGRIMSNGISAFNAAPSELTKPAFFP